MTAPRRGRDRRTLAAVLGTLLTVALTVLGSGAAVGTVASAPPAATATADVVVQVTRVEPQVLRPGEDLRVTVRMTNRTAAPVAEPRLLLHLDRRSFISRSSLDRWRTAGMQDPVGGEVASLDVAAPLPPGAATSVTLTLPAGSVDLRHGQASWGPRGVAVEVVDVADPARKRLGLARTFLLWFPVDDVTPTRVSTLVPIVGPAVDPYDTAWVDELEDLTAPDGRLGRVLEATAGHPSVTWVLDPWLVDVTDPDSAARTRGAGPQADGADDAPTTPPTPRTTSGTEVPGTSDQEEEPDDDVTGPPPGDVGLDVGPFGPLSAMVAGQGARDWAAALLEATVRRDVELLPYLDPDLAALAHAADDGRIMTARARAADVVARTELPDGTPASLGWPSGPVPDRVTAAFATRHGARAVVVGPGELPASPSLTYTPSGRAVVTTDVGEAVLLVPDQRLSTALGTGSPLAAVVPRDDEGPTDQDGGTVAPPTPAVAAQDLLAELAVITRERPSDSRHMLLTAPRDWEPEPAVVDAQLTALDGAPWVQQESISALVGSPDTGVDRPDPPSRVVSGTELDPAALATAAAAVERRLGLAEMVASPAELVGDTDLELLAPAASAWRDRPADRAALVDRTVAATAALRESIGVQQGSTVNLIATSGGLPVRLTNSLPQDATVLVSLRPADARLRSDEPVRATVRAGGEELVQVPVHAIQSADVEVTVEVRTLAGEIVDDGTSLLVRVRAEWEGIGTAVIAGLLAVGMVVGLIRSIRRGRITGRRAHPLPDLGPDALSPEEREEALAEASGSTGSADQEPAGRSGGT